jgi:hypothetical protein
MANVLVQDGAGVAKYLKATGDGSNGDPFVVQHLMGSGATDDAAAAGELYPLAGIYMAENSIDSIDDGDIGRARISQRRVLLTQRPHLWAHAVSSTVTQAQDFETRVDGDSHSVSDWSAAATDWFSGADAGFGAVPRCLRFFMASRGFEKAHISIQQTLGVNCTVELQAITGAIGNSLCVVKLDEVTLATAGTVQWTPFAVGAAGNANARTVPAIMSPCMYLCLKFTPASDPSSGALRVEVMRN